MVEPILHEYCVCQQSSYLFAIESTSAYDGRSCCSKLGSYHNEDHCIEYQCKFPYLISVADVAIVCLPRSAEKCTHWNVRDPCLYLLPQWLCGICFQAELQGLGEAVARCCGTEAQNIGLPCFIDDKGACRELTIERRMTAKMKRLDASRLLLSNSNKHVGIYWLFGVMRIEQMAMKASILAAARKLARVKFSI